MTAPEGTPTTDPVEALADLRRREAGEEDFIRWEMDWQRRDATPVPATEPGRVLNVFGNLIPDPFGNPLDKASDV